MDPLPGYEVAKKVLLLNKLRIALNKYWNLGTTDLVTSCFIKVANLITASFVKNTPIGIIVLLLHVNDMIINREQSSREALWTKIKSINEEPLSNPTPYQQLIGALTYLTITRTDVVHVVHGVNQFQQNTTAVYMGVVFWIIRYIKNSSNKLLFVSSSFFNIIMYIDADRRRDPKINTS